MFLGSTSTCTGQQASRGKRGSLDRVNSTDKNRLSFHPLPLYSIASKYLDNLAWYFGSRPLSVDVSWEGEERGGEGLKEGERGGGEEWAGYSRHLSSVSLWALEEGEAHMHWEKHTLSLSHTYSGGHIFTARSPDWQQQTELRASTTEQRGRTGNKGGIHTRRGDYTGFASFSFLSLLSGSQKKESAPCSSWAELASAPCYGSPGGTWEHCLPLILFLSSLDYNPPMGSVDSFNPSVGL